jgi:hypothetical protein
MSIISAVRNHGIFIETFVQIPIARQVMIHAQDVWRARILYEPVKLTLLDAKIPKIVPQWVWLVDAAAQQIKCQPTALVIEARLVGHAGSAESFAEIVRLDQPRLRINCVNFAHRQRNSQALLH